MKTNKNLFHRSSAVAFATVVIALSSPLHAATFTWDGGHPTSNSWGSAENWDPDGVPAFGNEADLVFNVLTRPNNFIGAIRTIRSITYGADIDGSFQTNYQDFSGGTSRVLTMEALTGNATITVDANSTGAITLGTAGGTGTFGTMALAANLDVVHNGSGLLLFNRAISGTAFGITKTGTGTMRTDNFNTFTGAININQGTLVANTFGTNGEDLNAASTINLGGGALEIRGPGINKTYATVPVNVTAAGTLTYNNTSSTTYTAQFTGANAFAVGADLTVKNTSINTAVVNPFNIARAVTGTGDMLVETYNNIATTADNFSLGRVLLSGDNSGTTADAFGAGLTFFPTGSNGSTITYANNITATTGGFRAIKGGGTNHSVTLTGTVALNGNLTVDHTWSGADRRISLNGNISGNGGLTITRVGGSAATSSRLTGTNTYLGDTTVTTGASLALASTCSLSSNVVVQSGARIGGPATLGGNLTIADTSNFYFFYSLGYIPMSVAGTVTVGNGFGVANLVGGSQGEVVPWASIPDGTYTLIANPSGNFSNITNFGSANAFDLGGGRGAYFQNGGGLQLVLTTAVSGFSAWQAANGNTAGGLDADHDNDGVDNGTEYFLGGNTSTTGFTSLPGVTSNSITWIKAGTGYDGAYNTDFFVETSETLEAGSWVAAPLGAAAGEVLITGNDVKYTFPAGIKKFARLKVTGP
jgi:autotransporter-associated beta strand protein